MDGFGTILLGFAGVIFRILEFAEESWVFAEVIPFSAEILEIPPNISKTRRTSSNFRRTYLKFRSHFTTHMPKMRPNPPQEKAF